MDPEKYRGPLKPKASQLLQTESLAKLRFRFYLSRLNGPEQITQLPLYFRGRGGWGRGVIGLAQPQF